MAVIKAKPTSPGRRGVISVKADLYKGKPLKSLIQPNQRMVEEIIMAVLLLDIKAEAINSITEL